MSRLFTIEYEHTWPMTKWADESDLPMAEDESPYIYGKDAGEPTGQRFLTDVRGVRDEAHALEIVKEDAIKGFGTIVHSVTPQPDGYKSRSHRRKELG